MTTNNSQSTIQYISLSARRLLNLLNLFRRGLKEVFGLGQIIFVPVLSGIRTDRQNAFRKQDGRTLSPKNDSWKHLRKYFSVTLIVSPEECCILKISSCRSSSCSCRSSRRRKRDDSDEEIRNEPHKQDYRVPTNKRLQRSLH